MYSIKVVPQEGDRHTKIFPTETVSFKNLGHVGNLEDAIKIFEKIGKWQAVWTMPINDPEDTNPEEPSFGFWPEGGIWMNVFTTYKKDGTRFGKYKTYIAYDCTLYVLNEIGKTIDKA